LRQQALRNRRRLKLMTWVILITWLSSLGTSVTVLVVGLLRGRPPSLFWSLGAGLLLLVAWQVTPRIDGQIRTYENYKEGHKGELRVARALQRALDARWTLFQNVVLPEGRGDIDAVLVGPTGLYVLEIKAYSGDNRNIGKKWQRRYFGIWRTLGRSPTQQARRNAQRLHNYLARCDVDLWVEPRVVWATQAKLWLEKPAVPVWQLSRSEFVLQDLAKGQALPEESVRQIVSLLKANQLSRSE
jgi:hypothetical protein